MFDFFKRKKKKENVKIAINILVLYSYLSSPTHTGLAAIFDRIPKNITHIIKNTYTFISILSPYT